MSTQVQRRRGTTAQHSTFTGALGEITVDTDRDSLVVHDGSKQGGFPCPNERDIIGNYYNYATAGGTADALTLTVNTDITALAAGQIFYFKASANNTTTATMTITNGDGTGLGAKTLKKKDSETTALVNLVAGDIISGAIYAAMYDGTDIQILSVDAGGLTSVSQGDLNTSTGTFSENTSSNPVHTGAIFGVGSDVNDITLPGGQYGLTIETDSPNSGQGAGWLYGTNNTSYSATVFPYIFEDSSYPGAQSIGGRQRYITASPPFNMGDGNAAGFLFYKINQNADILAHYAADVPPWAYNGPTNIRADFINRINKKKFRKVLKKRNIDQILSNEKMEFELEEITDDIKNADMSIIPHPFGKLKSGQSIVMIDPMDDKIKRLIDAQNAGEDLRDFIKNGLIFDEEITRAGPPGVNILKFKRR